MDFNRIIQGMIRAARLDKTFYEEVEHDASYSQDALIVVILASIAGGIGAFLGGLIARSMVAAIVMFIVQAVLGVLGYYLWAFIAQWVGTKFFKGTGDFGEVSRAVGFAYAPRVLNLLSFIPCVGGLIGFATAIWSIATGFIAIRQSLDQDDTNALLTAIVSGVIVFAIIFVITAIVGVAVGLGAAATGALTGQ